MLEKKKIGFLCLIGIFAAGIYLDRAIKETYPDPTPQLPADQPQAVALSSEQEEVTAPANAVAIVDFLADQGEMKAGAEKIIGPGRMGCIGGSLCGLYDPNNYMVYAMVDISKLSHEDKVRFMTGNPLSGPLVYLAIKHTKTNTLAQNYALNIIP